MQKNNFKDQQGLPKDPNEKGQGEPKPNSSNFGSARNENSENTDYKREGAHMGADIDKSQASTQKGGGGSGYDVNREKEQINKEQEKMHNERDNEKLNPERTATPQPEIDPGRENPSKPSPGRETNPDSFGASDSNSSSNWNQSSWDPNSIH
jgi:hypothetical protein